MSKLNISSTTIRYLAFAGVAVVILLFRPMTVHTFPYEYQEGKLWLHETLRADFDFPIYKSAERLQQEQEQALQAYGPCFQTVGEASSMFVLSLEDMQRVRQGNYDHIAVVNRKHVSTDIPIENLYTPKSAYRLTQEVYEPTLVFDSLTSRRVYDNLLESVSPTEGAVFMGETIIEHGELISHEDFLVLASLERAYTDRGNDEQHVLTLRLAYSLLTILLIALFVAYLQIFRKPLWEQTSTVLFFCLLMALLAGGTMVALNYSLQRLIFVIPFVWGPILVRVFYDSRTAFFLHLVVVLLVSLAVPNPFPFIVMQLMAGIVTVCSLKDITHRSQLVVTAFYVLLTYGVAYSILKLMLSGDVSQLDWHIYLDFLLNALLIVMVYSLIFIFEKIFRLVSGITLVELSNINSDLLQEFARVAPGTFQHSLQVSSLASDAAKCIGAKALLVRTGALYHDLGKMAHPEWYTENQADGQNPLLAMSNREAAQAVIAHVNEGELLARKHRLPEVIVSFIRTHHGTSLVRYFYNSEVNRIHDSQLSEDLITITDYQYAGPKPTSKEMAILMMADAVEARSRSLDIYTEDSISQMVDNMISLQVQDGQLTETPLSFHDLERVKQSFKERLMTIYHRRIQYPTLTP